MLEQLLKTFVRHNRNISQSSTLTGVGEKSICASGAHQLETINVKRFIEQRTRNAWKILVNRLIDDADGREMKIFLCLQRARQEQQKFEDFARYKEGNVKPLCNFHWLR